MQKTKEEGRLHYLGYITSTMDSPKDVQANEF